MLTARVQPASIAAASQVGQRSQVRVLPDGGRGALEMRGIEQTFLMVLPTASPGAGVERMIRHYPQAL